MNLLTSYLKALHVKYTRRYAELMYKTTPRRNTLWGLAKMLRKYGVESVALRIEDKEKVKGLEMPWIAETEDGFAIVRSVHNDEVTYVGPKGKLKTDFDAFKDIWTGVALVPTDVSNAEEPDYSKHLKDMVIKRGLEIMVIMGVGLFLFSQMQGTPITIDNGITFIFSLIGLLLSSVLLIEHMGHQIGIADRVCNVLSRHGCSNVLESDGAYAIGCITWSECGMAFFSGNALIAVCYPSTSAILLPWIVVCALPLSFWSIWYQARKVKSWCALCLLTMATLWCTFGMLLVSDAYRSIPPSIVSDVNLYLVPCIYVMLLTGIHFLTQSLHLKSELHKAEYENNTVKSDIQVFRALLQQQEYMECPIDIPSLCLGQPTQSVPQVWVVSNPYCTPCARTHEYMDRLVRNGMSVHYLMTTFNDELLEANRYIMAYYHKFGADASREMLADWFKSGKEQGWSFFEGKVSEEEAHSPAIEAEIQAQLKWIDAHHIHETPYVLIDGYKKPDIYSWDDIVELLKDMKS